VHYPVLLHAQHEVREYVVIVILRADTARGYLPKASISLLSSRLNLLGQVAMLGCGCCALTLHGSVNWN
jgi:hypothetical protein